MPRIKIGNYRISVDKIVFVVEFPNSDPDMFSCAIKFAAIGPEGDLDLWFTGDQARLFLRKYDSLAAYV